ncbi:MAG: pyruvate synthase [Candidatus Moranbacteria bacterium CG_4_8_14_3_um_filter_34_16]|nr:MAG: pyruvate synthase [Candidatus Moranbacteria bacterium CG08_land_8_20_14_0_20_34_16]PIW94906.1 MAG: pyruvate synthase [Candidatus Moranbacteria bacterium CG_4_8_14_3_um_filter_34_16]PJA89094.1 MAG: pyruvate synthase [Candidatus Moranbacteria bacterium CG_4_9_14_3_um_filter_33_15]
MKYHKEIFEVIFFARGGQGAKTAAEILAQSAVRENKYVQAFPNFGPERSGAPTKTYLRISQKPILTHEPIVDPDVVVVLDDTLLNSQDVSKNVEKNEALIVNTQLSKDDIQQTISEKGKKFEGKIYPVNADGISLEIVGQPRPNTVILGKFVQVTEAVKLESVIAEFKEIFEKKIGKEITQKNVNAIEKAYDTI